MNALHPDIAKERETSPNYPFTDDMKFCSKHTRDSDVIDVIECRNCRPMQTLWYPHIKAALDAVDPFAFTYPCYTRIPVSTLELLQFAERCQSA